MPASEPKIVCTPCPDVVPESELNLLAEVYGFILRCGEERRAAGVSSTNGDGATKGFRISEKEKGGRHVEL